MRLAYCLYMGQIGLFGAIVGVIALSYGCLPYLFVIVAYYALYGFIGIMWVFAVYNT